MIQTGEEDSAAHPAPVPLVLSQQYPDPMYQILLYIQIALIMHNMWIMLPLREATTSTLPSCRDNRQHEGRDMMCRMRITRITIIMLSICMLILKLMLGRMTMMCMRRCIFRDRLPWTLTHP